MRNGICNPVTGLRHSFPAGKRPPLREPWARPACRWPAEDLVQLSGGHSAGRPGLDLAVRRYSSKMSPPTSGSGAAPLPRRPPGSPERRFPRPLPTLLPALVTGLRLSRPGGSGGSHCRWRFTEQAVRHGPLVGADPQVIVAFVSSWGAGGEPELPDWRETTRDCGESFAAQPWAERDDGSVVHPREAAELGEPTAVRDRSLTRANGADQMVSFGGNVRKQEPKICLPCLGRRPGLQCLIHQ